MSDLIVRAAEPADMAAIHRIYTHEVLHGIATFEEVPPDLSEMTRRWQAVCDAGLPWLVAERAGAVVGYAYAGRYHARSAYRFTLEDSVYIAPEARGAGVGKALLRRLIALCGSGGARQMLAIIGNSGNAGSVGLHRSLGFADVGVLRSVGFKHGRWIDVVVMQLALGAGDATLPSD
ncbi:GNAT family N-acetyltransferase [Tropicimonas sp. IMCC34043]|uniref:GNAT family N-acetyltransferase n=1 Tax=Tropicimonas sp. IMCC34043 TaxID=2248760 RepID=UPI000E275BCB|nr:GNAT family N-acetyltransferase [Tropicimonas sp. IMCC34043]